MSFIFLANAGFVCAGLVLLLPIHRVWFVFIIINVKNHSFLNISHDDFTSALHFAYQLNVMKFNPLQHSSELDGSSV